MTVIEDERMTVIEDDSNAVLEGYDAGREREELLLNTSCVWVRVYVTNNNNECTGQRVDDIRLIKSVVENNAQGDFSHH
jgi:hypothetical protein